MKTIKMIAVTLGATAMGVTLGMLFAPGKGSKTRHSISKKSHQYSDRIADSFDDFLDTLSQSFESVENEAARLAKNGKYKAKKISADLRSIKS